ncbi:hypothetical protein EHO60_03320 [Leptospira fletcheri]|uniref:Uncharacterized protein n=1 Tax=Leptospira fletcheri TaxID=2484981 RepID=A0A4R9GFG9_9LEPT|nr:hypothetical protein [Leptospira fletcheri]TGK11358.1 hypothetical protein EHO60_03320 [Leptospira fletcheri]
MSNFKKASLSDGESDNERISEIMHLLNHPNTLKYGIIKIKLSNNTEILGFLKDIISESLGPFRNNRKRGEFEIVDIYNKSIFIDCLDVEEIDIIDDVKIISEFKEKGLGTVIIPRKSN